MARTSTHERAIRRELEAAEGAYAALSAELASKENQQAVLQDRLDLLRRLLEAGNAGQGDES